MARPQLRPIGPAVWEISRHGRMRVPGRVYATSAMLPDLTRDQALQQVVNVATLPGIVGASLAMPDIHWGYGFPIGGVAAFDPDKGGIVSPGGVGYDINCGVRLLATGLTDDEVRPRLEELLAELFRSVPCGVGSKRGRALSDRELERVMVEGAAWAVARGHGETGELELIEENGTMPGADPDRVGRRARDRGADQLGTLGSGNHFLEVQRVDEVFDHEAAAAMGLREGQVTVMVHTGSRGFGHQVCDDYVRTMLEASRRYGIELPDRQLCCAPLTSPEGKAYLGAMAAAVNYAFANRQIIASLVRRAFRAVLGRSDEATPRTVYEVAHNIAKWETHEVDGRRRRLCVHRKGATRAFAAGRSELPPRYRDLGQPVLIPGDMGRSSYVLLGRPAAMEQTFGSACHGAGRVLSRHQALKQGRGRDLVAEMHRRGVLVLAAGRRTIAEEMPEAYKDVSQVVDAVDLAGLASRVVRLRPLGVVKG